MAITPLIELYINTIKGNREINIVDIGAAEFDTTKNNYNSIINSYPFKIYGFEPNPDEFEKLKKIKIQKLHISHMLLEMEVYISFLFAKFRDAPLS
ncbi:hypothetical protein XBO1_2340032 [Xenorhabdus bovienii str. oregonense]|uniref:Uncharacterized protein n=1 Tax=Xenorhabdus bovienii str. oregonense TaxID=1398202 RepID=A0A077P6R4_XENBV|nr:hypothetical protein [Xenorhabdus bovienii]CDH06539.1 hypothetical protein XBO1_2340032 [Xenorhabdus bovienii str. oregonense]